MTAGDSPDRKEGLHFEDLLQALAQEHRREVAHLRRELRELQDGVRPTNSTRSNSWMLSSPSPAGVPAPRLQVDTVVDRPGQTVGSVPVPRLAGISPDPGQGRRSLREICQAQHLPVGADAPISAPGSLPLRPIAPVLPPPALVSSAGDGVARTKSKDQLISYQSSGQILVHDDSRDMIRKVAQPLYRDCAAQHWKRVLHKGTDTSTPDGCLGSWRWRLDMFLAGLIALNTAFVGWCVQHRAVHRSTSTLDDVGSLIFCLLFCAELVLRWRSVGWIWFFRGKERGWNIFDLIIVSLMLIEESIRLAGRGTPLAEHFYMLRVLQMLRLARLFYIVRLLAVFPEFRFLAVTLRCGFRAGFFVLTASLLVIYVAGVTLTVGTYEYCDHGFVEKDLCAHFGSVDSSVKYLYQAMFGGLLWGELLDILSALHFVYKLLFIVLVSFISLVALNLVLAVFLELKAEMSLTPEALLQAKKQDIRQLHTIFELLDVNNSGDISQTDFINALENPKLEGLLATLKLDVVDAKAAFNLLDRDQTGVVDRTEFVLGCMHLKGAAKTLDVLTLQANYASLLQHVLEVQQALLPLSEALLGTGSMSNPASMALAIRQAGVAFDEADREDRASPRERPARATNRMATMQSLRRPDPLSSLKSGCRIQRTEERAMSLRDLFALRREVLRQCEEGDWRDLVTDCPLRPEEVNLYHLSHYHICPSTCTEGTVLRGLKAEVEVGQVISQRDPTGTKAVPLAEGYVQDIDEHGNPHVLLMRGRFVCGVPVISSGEVEFGSPTEVESPGAMSYKELVSTGPLKPKWFCTHWWGEPVLDFVACCETHSELRGLRPGEASFWVCAYANCQHNLQTAIPEDPEQSSFRRAMKLAQGVLLVLDTNATPFKRIWCDFELYKTIAVDRKHLDIITVHDGRPRLLSEDCMPNETQHYKSLREQQFPTRLLVEGMRRRLEDGEASVQRDRENILASMAQDAPGESSPSDSLANALRRANSALHAYFSLAAWPAAANAGLIEDFDQERPGTLSLPEVLAGDTARQQLVLSLAHSSRVQDYDVCALARGLPPNLTELKLSFDGCPKVTDAGVKLLADQLPVCLKRLSLDFSNCREVTDAGIQSLAEDLPQSLNELDLCFAHCIEVTPLSVHVLADNLPGSLQRLFVAMRGTQVDRTFESAASLRRFVTSGKMGDIPGVAMNGIRTIVGQQRMLLSEVWGGAAQRLSTG